MTHNIITIKQCLIHMASGKPFSCKAVSYDRKRKTGGEIKEYPEAVLLQKDKEEMADTARPMTEVEKLRAKLQLELSPPKGGKNPHHHAHYTRNIRLLQNGHPTGIIKKLHPPLLLKFNQKTVVP